MPKPNRGKRGGVKRRQWQQNQPKSRPRQFSGEDGERRRQPSGIPPSLAEDHIYKYKVPPFSVEDMRGKASCICVWAVN